MINLLPLDTQRKNKNRYRRRLAVVVLVLSLILLAILILARLPVYILASRELEEVQEQIVFMEQLKKQETRKELPRLIAMENEKIGALYQTVYQIGIRDVLLQIAKHQTDTISITSLTVRKNPQNDSQKTALVVRGVALSRNDLISFVERLEKDPLFEKVTLPIGNLAKDTGLAFTISIESMFIPDDTDS